MRGVGTGGGDWQAPPGVERLQVDELGNVVASNCPIFGEVREEKKPAPSVSQHLAKLRMDSREAELLFVKVP